ncbi:MAG: tannase/feruloyl esterase family alpha/beta hydrolase [Candidatus Acidiferrales bacterium]
MALPAFGQTSRNATEPCEGLSKLALPEAKVISATRIAPGAYKPPGGAIGAGADLSFYEALPSFCRVTVVSKPSSDSDIAIEVWMPVKNWNGRFRAQGNGGFGGYIDYHGMGIDVREGFATASTDTGHTGSPIDGAWALKHPEKVIDFGYRAIHEMTVTAKAAIGAFYGEAPRYSYFGSCSNGGRQALMEVQRFPSDYNGVIAGAPANFWSHLLATGVWNAQALTASAGSYIPSKKLPVIASAVNAACDAKDGVRDGVLNDPRKCHFDPATLLCLCGDSDFCLTAAQVTTLKKLYAGSRDSSGRQIFPGFLPGGEEGEGGWALWITGSVPGRALLFDFVDGYFADMVYDDPSWNYRTAKLDDAVKAADQKTGRELNATDPNLRAFAGRGGKLIIYHGWNDPAIPALNTIHYYDAVLRTLGEKDVNSFVRLYMIPGMQHCEGGPGADSFDAPGDGESRQGDARHDIQAAMQAWVERGIAPGTIVAAHYDGKKLKMTRPLCPYPEEAHYKGTGNSNDAANFVCSAGN